MILHANIPVSVNGSEQRATVEEYTRGGTRSPHLYIIVYQGKRYVPKAQKLAGISITVGGYFKIVYSQDYVKDLVYARNPFMSLVLKPPIHYYGKI